MRNPIHVLKSLEEKATVANYKYERLYRNLYNPEFYMIAYANLAKSQGSMTAGVDGETLDNMSLPRINRIIEKIKDKSYQPKPAKRKYIPKKNGKLRPLGIMSTDDKLVQEVVRMLLEAIYEPTFSRQSHGFRPKKSVHTALMQVKKSFTGVNWIVEGDIKACFDNFDHHVLIDLLRRRITDEAFINLIWKFLKAGYMEQWEYNCTYSGTPQGSGISPICANIYLSELDSFLMRYKESYDREPARRKTTKEYEKASRRYKKARKALELAEESTPEMVAEFKAARKGKMSQHYHDPFEQGYKKIQYNRYADDFVIGVIGSKKDAMEIKENVKVFLRDVLHLEMSDEKTKVTHSSKKVMENEAVQVKRDPVSGKETWRPMPRKELMNRNDADIVSTFNSEIYGLYNFYRIAENVGVLHKYYYMVRYSMLKTLAGKHRTYVSAIKKRYMRNGVLRIPYQTQKGLKYCEFYHGGFKKHSDGYDNVSDILPVYKKYDRRFTIVNRIKAGLCEICGASAEYVCMHHVRSLKALNGTDIFERKMLEIRRKSLALCPDCWNELQLVLISG